MKRIIVNTLSLVVVLGMVLSAVSIASASDLLSYEDAIERFGSISLTDREELILIYKSFEAIGSRYFAPQYMYLTATLLELSGDEDVDFDRLVIALTVLKSNGTFIEKYTADESLSYLPLDVLLNYVNARRLEANGKLEEAYQAYTANQILDSVDRAIAIQYQWSETSTTKQSPEPTPVPTAEPTPESANESATADLQYSVKEDGTAVITGYEGSESVITIPSVIDGHDVVGIGDYAFYYCKTLTKILFPDSLQSIGVRAFDGCRSLSDIILPEGLQSLGERAFKECVALEEITLPESLIYIGLNPFVYCHNLSAINIAPGHEIYQTIDGALYNMKDSMLIAYPCGREEGSYTIPQGIRIIGSYAFAHCYSLANIALPDSLVLIGDSAFSSCYKMVEIKFPESLQTINDFAFIGCGFTAVTLPDGLKKIGEYAFSCCRSLTAISISTDNPVFQSIDGVLYDKENQTLVIYPAGKRDLLYTVLPGTQSIGDGAFEGCDYIAYVILPISIQSIGAWAFDMCSALASINLPDNLQTIGNDAFQLCSSLATLSLPETVRYIGEDAFEDCDALILIVPRDSYAQQYAEDNHLSFQYADN